ncbi:MAG: hypothetical protein HYS62_01215 [Candidatus Aenigmarchaeota archaeon]|nr:hypothetical protein [Candidatus Aenigmarchaeota archaeon]
MKGQAWIQNWFALLLTGVIAVGVLPFILPGQVTKVSPEIEAKEFENKAILLANSLLANEDLVYSDGTNWHRATFDANKINDVFYEDSFGTSLYTCKPNLSNCKLPTYSQTFAFIVIVDIETGEGWFTGTHKLSGSEPEVLNVISCFQNKWSTNYPQLYEENSDIDKVLELDNCALQRYSSILSTGFPVSIKYPSGDVHMGAIKIVVVE